MDISDQEMRRFTALAKASAQEKGVAFATPALVEYLSHPVAHWQITSSPNQDQVVVVLLDARGEFINLERRPVIAARRGFRSWLRGFLGYSDS